MSVLSIIYENDRFDIKICSQGCIVTCCAMYRVMGYPVWGYGVPGMGVGVPGIVGFGCILLYLGHFDTNLAVFDHFDPKYGYFDTKYGYFGPF